jgi:hypothetical protein
MTDEAYDATTPPRGAQCRVALGPTLHRRTYCGRPVRASLPNFYQLPPGFENGPVECWRIFLKAPVVRQPESGE